MSTTDGSELTVPTDQNMTIRNAICDEHNRIKALTSCLLPPHRERDIVTPRQRLGVPAGLCMMW